MMTELIAFRDLLAGISGVASCKVGLEKNITPNQYPLIRLVPQELADGEFIGRRHIALLIYFGMPIQEYDDTPDGAGLVRMEKLYAALFGLEASIRAVIDQNGGVYKRTITDEDRLDTYKLMAIECEIDV